MLTLLTACTPEAINWDWLQLQPPKSAKSQLPGTPESGVASLTGQDPASANQSAPLDPRIQEFIDRLATYDQKTGDPSPPQQDQSLNPVAAKPVAFPVSARPKPTAVKSPDHVAANGPVTLDQQAPPVVEDSIDVVPAQAVQAKPQLMGVAVEADASGAGNSSQQRTSAANAPMSAQQVEKRSAETYLEWLKENAEKAPHDSNLQWRIALQERALGKAPSEVSSGSLADDQRRLMTQSLEALDDLERAAADPNRSADEALGSINTLRSELQGYAGLRIPTVRLCTKVTAFGVYDVLPESDLAPFRTNRAIVYTEVENFQSQQEEADRWISKLSCQLELLTTDGQSLWRHEEPTIEDVSRRCRSDFFLAQLVTFPPTIAPGNYVLKVTIEDMIAGKINQGTYAFTVGGTTAEPSN